MFQDGLTADITALAQSHSEVGDLIGKLKNVSGQMCPSEFEVHFTIFFFEGSIARRIHSAANS